ncbi:hypothetical protein BC940DRAFT_293039 [Gongronella butleri]|nr:hypothetical protein BC940DRAFT_293039 [Gongronella butleri]
MPVDEPIGSRLPPRRSSRSANKDEHQQRVASPEPVQALSPSSSNHTSNDTADSPASTSTPTEQAASNSSSTHGLGGSSSSSSLAASSAAGGVGGAGASHSRVTRSLSADSNSNDDTNNGAKRRRTGGKPGPKKKQQPHSPSKSPPRNPDEFERETRNTTHRLSKEAKDARKAERELVIKKKLAELDMLERTVKDHSHEEYHKLLEEIQAKRTKKLSVAEGRHELMESNFRNGFLAQKKSAFDKYHLDKLALRRTMIHQVQQKINRIEQEYYSSQQGNKSSLDDQNLADWTPPDRPSMISSLTLGLNEQEVSHDFHELQDLIPGSPTLEELHPLDAPEKKESTGTMPLISSS